MRRFFAIPLAMLVLGITAPTLADGPTTTVGQRHVGFSRINSR